MQITLNLREQTLLRDAIVTEIESLKEWLDYQVYSSDELSDIKCDIKELERLLDEVKR